MKIKTCNHKDHVGERNLSISEFRKMARNKDGLASQCKYCADRLTKASEAKRPGVKYQIAKKRRQSLMEDYRKWKSATGCLCCNETVAVCLELHHIDPAQKEINVSDALRNGWSWERIMKEADKCEVLCANCHRKVHADLINLDDYK